MWWLSSARFGANVLRESLSKGFDEALYGDFPKTRGYLWRSPLAISGILLGVVWLGMVTADAQDATWQTSPGSGDWNTPANWGISVPTGTATFNKSSTTSITFSNNTSVDTLQFNAGAPVYSFSLATALLTITGTGIVNNSSNSPIFSTAGIVVGIDRLNFQGGSSAGNATVTNNSGGGISFSDTSTADHATITNNVGGNTNFFNTSTAGHATITDIVGSTKFSDASTAGNATLIDDPGELSGFQNTSTAGHATILNNGGSLGFTDASTAANATITNISSGQTEFFNTSKVGNATITNASAGNTVFSNTSTAANFTITNNSGGITIFFDTTTAGDSVITNNSGGATEFFDTSTGGQARFITKAGGIFDTSGRSTSGITAGSIEGAGAYQLGSSALTVGSNNLSTIVSGRITDGGIFGGQGAALIKTGTGTLTLTGLNTYSGGTSFNGGILAVNSDLNLGTGPLSFNGGTLQALAAGGGITSTKAITFNSGGATFLADAGTTSILSGTIRGAGSLTKLGPGTLALTGTSGYSGDTDLVGGTLIIQKGGSISDLNSSIGKASGSSGTFAVDGVGSLWANSGALFVGGNSGGPAGAGVLQITGGGTVSAAATTIWTGGTLALGGSVTLHSPLTLNGGTIFTVANTAFPNSATIGVGGTLFNSNGFDSTFSGAFIGLGGITKISPGSVTLTGANAYSGGTHINGGTLAINSDRNLGTGALSLTGGTVEVLTAGGGITSNKAVTLNGVGGTFLADAGTNSTLNGVTNGPGALIKEGPGTLELTGANSYSGGTVLNAGTLTVQGAHALGAGNVVLNGGTLNADPQPINVRGNYTQNPGATLQLQVAGAQPGQYDALKVTGNASLGGTLQLLSLGFQPKAGNLLTLLSAGGVVSNRFANFVDPFVAGPEFDLAELLYERNSVLLLFLSFDLETSVEGLTAFYEISFSNANIQRLNLENRLDDLRNGSSGFSSNMKVNGATVNLDGNAAADGKSSKNVVEPILQPGPENRWGVWMTGFGDFVSVEGDGNTKGYNFTTGGVSLGLDYRITDQLAVGVMGDYAHTRTALQPSGHLDVNNGRGGVYATWFNHGLYLDGAIYAGHNNYDSGRAGPGGLANGSTEGTDWSAFLSAGYDFHAGPLTLGPIAAVQYTYVKIDSFTENGSLAPLQIHSGSAESLRTDLGFRAFYQWQIGKILVEPSIKVAWEHEYKYSALPITAGFAGIPGPSSTFFGPSEGHDSAIVSAGISVQWTPAISTYVNYDGQLGRQNYDSNAVTGGVRLSF